MTIIFLRVSEVTQNYYDYNDLVVRSGAAFLSAVVLRSMAYSMILNRLWQGGCDERYGGRSELLQNDRRKMSMSATATTGYERRVRIVPRSPVRKVCVL